MPLSCLCVTQSVSLEEDFTPVFIVIDCCLGSLSSMYSASLETFRGGKMWSCGECGSLTRAG